MAEQAERPANPPQTAPDVSGKASGAPAQEGRSPGPAGDGPAGTPGGSGAEAKSAGDPTRSAGDAAEGLAASLGGARSAAKSPGEGAGDEERTWQQQEIRDTLAAALSSFGSRSSGVIVVGDGHTFSGPITGGDSRTGADRSRAVLRTFTAGFVAGTARVYVSPDGYVDLAEALEDSPVLLIRARRRWGSTTTAVRLLSEMETVHELRFADALAALPIEDLPEGCGFVIERLSKNQLGTLYARELPMLEERLARRRGRLVVIVDDSVRASDHAVDRLARQIAAPPVALKLVTSHLAELLGSDAEAERLLADENVGTRLADIAPESFDAPQLVELAKDLAEVASGTGTVADAMARFEDRSRRDVEDWYDELATFDERALVVAIAVLDRMSFDAVSRAATLLEQAWREDEAGNGQAPPRSRQTRRSRLQAARARIDTEVRRTRYGWAELEVVSFVDPNYPARLLHHLWHEHYYDRALLLDWLRRVASDVEGAVGIRAATAIGYLSQFAFDTIRRDIVTPWAGSGRGNEREWAVAALALPARDPATASRVIRLVLDWADRDSLALRLSAARALGASVGAVLDGGPDEHLAELADGAETPLQLAIGDSIAELMAEATLDRQTELLRLLDAWSVQSRSGRLYAGVVGFLEVAATLWTNQKTPDGDVAWPILLWTAGEGGRPVTVPDDGVVPAEGWSEAGQIVARLWGRALVAPGVDTAVHNVLRRWAQAAEEAPALRPALVSLLMKAAATDRQRHLLTAHANRWRDPKPLAPDLAARLLNVLSRRVGVW
ncbi:hypothetical protein V1634_02290 [Plantactinospora veratri]|uniref:Uncharacterized protein n=1 Tax=Plantactinospora veratri TaxID=1436122 RepID=A0ABU7S6U6_9ACTN